MGKRVIVFGRERLWSAREIESTYYYYVVLPTTDSHENLATHNHVSEGVVRTGSKLSYS